MYKPYPGGSQTGATVVTVVVEEEGRSEEGMGGEVEVRESASRESDTSCSSTSSDGSAKELLKRNINVS